MSRVPDLPYWGSQIHSAIKTAGSIQNPAVKLKMSIPFWMSEFRNKTLAETQTLYATCGGIPAGGGGPNGAGGYVNGQYARGMGIFSKSYSKVQWRTGRDIAVRGADVSDAAVAAIGLDPKEVPVAITPTPYMLQGIFDHRITSGYFVFQPSSSWGNAAHYAIRSNDEGYGGRRTCVQYCVLPIPADNQIIVPSWSDSGGADGGSHGLSVRCRINDSSTVDVNGNPVPLPSYASPAGNFNMESVYRNGSYNFRGTFNLWPNIW